LPDNNNTCECLNGALFARELNFSKTPLLDACSCYVQEMIYNYSARACIDCPIGALYNSTSRNCSCINGGIFQYSGIGSLDMNFYCTSCPDGEYFNGELMCKTCPVSTFYNSSIRDCQCLSGAIFRSNLTVDLCCSCPPGQYFDENFNCQTCPFGTIWSRSLKDCYCLNGGIFRSSNTSDLNNGTILYFCEICPLDMVFDENRNCINCSSSTYFNASKNDCECINYGIFRDTNNSTFLPRCNLCYPNYYFDAQNICKACPSTTVYDESSRDCSCSNDALFRHSVLDVNFTGIVEEIDTKCSWCPVGMYFNETNKCSACPAHTVYDSILRDCSCVNAAVFRILKSDSNFTLHDVGTQVNLSVSLSSDINSCMNCQFGYYFNSNLTCTSCPSFTAPISLRKQATVINDCVCKTGALFRDPIQNSLLMCSMCAEGMYFDNNLSCQVKIIHCSTYFLKFCPQNTYFESNDCYCSNGAYFRFPLSVLNKNYVDTSCSLCPIGSYFNNHNICQVCPSSSSFYEDSIQDCQCRNGAMFRDLSRPVQVDINCSTCPKGSYFDANMICQICPLSTVYHPLLLDCACLNRGIFRYRDAEQDKIDLNCSECSFGEYFNYNSTCQVNSNFLSTIMFLKGLSIRNCCFSKFNMRL